LARTRVFGIRVRYRHYLGNAASRARDPALASNACRASLRDHRTAAYRAKREGGFNSVADHGLDGRLKAAGLESGKPRRQVPPMRNDQLKRLLSREDQQHDPVGQIHGRTRRVGWQDRFLRWICRLNQRITLVMVEGPFRDDCHRRRVLPLILLPARISMGQADNGKYEGNQVDAGPERDQGPLRAWAKYPSPWLSGSVNPRIRGKGPRSNRRRRPS
jgi:hypothetical protein